MPIYEYQCTGCHHEFDLMQKIHDEPAKKCPQCFEDTLIRLVSAAGFQLKGTGWYATDFKDKGKPPNKSEKSDSAPAAEKSDAAPKTTDASTTSKKSKGETD